MKIRNLNIPFYNRFSPITLEILGGTFISMTLKIVGAVLTFIFSIVLARKLGAGGAGDFFLALTVITISSVLGRMGLDSSLLRFTAANAAMDDWIGIKGLYSKGIKLALVSSILFSIGVFSLSPWIAENIFNKPGFSITLRGMTIAIVPMSLILLHAYLLKGLTRIRDSILVESVGTPLVTLLLFFVFFRRFNSATAVYAYVTGTILTAIYSILRWQSATKRMRKLKGEFDTRTLLRSCLPLYWFAIMVLIINWTSILMLGIWAGSKDVGIFGIASRSATLSSLVLFAVNSIAAPKFASLYKKGDMATLSAVARSTNRIMIVVAAPILLFCVAAPEWVMGLFGNEFRKGSTALIILSIGQFVNVSTGSVGYLLVMSGFEKSMRNNATMSAIVNIILNIILVPYYGINGAAVATSISLIWINLASVVSAYKKLSIKIISIPKWCLFYAK